jgi:hypothetical protein
LPARSIVPEHAGLKLASYNAGTQLVTLASTPNLGNEKKHASPANQLAQLCYQRQIESPVQNFGRNGFVMGGHARDEEQRLGGSVQRSSMRRGAVVSHPLISACEKFIRYRRRRFESERN